MPRDGVCVGGASVGDRFVCRSGAVLEVVNYADAAVGDGHTYWWLTGTDPQKAGWRFFGQPESTKNVLGRLVVPGNF